MENTSAGSRRIRDFSRNWRNSVLASGKVGIIPREFVNKIKEMPSF